MSGPRRLWVRYRRVAADRMDAYRRAVSEAGVGASGFAAHFWAFQLDGGEGGFIEFLEGPEDGALERLRVSTDEALRAAAGGVECTGLEVGAAGLRCTAFGQD